MSLDIDFDVLFTENAPVDAIVQRAGRVNRKRNKPDTKVVVFKHSQITEDYVYDIPDILNNTYNLLDLGEFHKKKEKGQKIVLIFHPIVNSLTKTNKTMGKKLAAIRHLTSTL